MGCWSGDPAAEAFPQHALSDDSPAAQRCACCTGESHLGSGSGAETGRDCWGSPRQVPSQPFCLTLPCPFPPLRMALPCFPLYLSFCYSNWDLVAPVFFSLFSFNFFFSFLDLYPHFAVFFILNLSFSPFTPSFQSSIFLSLPAWSLFKEHPSVPHTVRRSAALGAPV